MLQRSKIAIIVLFVLMALLTVLPISAQDSSTTGLSVDISTAGVSVYRTYDDGTLALVIFIPSITTSPIVEVDAQAAQASDIAPLGYLIINTPSLNVRTGPGAQYTSLGVIAGGDEVHVVGKNDGREFWWFVELDDGTRGWINNIHVLIRGDLSDVPVVEHDGVLIAPTLYVGYTGNPIFPTVPHNGVAVCTIMGNTDFPIVGRTRFNTWYQIAATCLDGTAAIGWIQADLGIVRNPAGIQFPVTN